MSPTRPLARALLRGLLALVLGVVVVLPTAAAASPQSSGASVRSFFVPVAEAPGGDERIRIDADLYTPERTPAPAVLLAHGFGGSKADLAEQARRLQGDGYVVLAYSARGFGASEGRIGLDSLDGEVPDARALVDVLAAAPEVLRRGGDPVVGVVGGSYGGALALMLGATDPRIDAVVAAITWNDLAQALVPASAGSVGSAGGGEVLRDFKSGWTSRLFGAGIGDSADPCGRFTAEFCAVYRRLVTGGAPTAADLALLERSSPAAVLDRIRAPVLLMQGLRDSLFGLDQADANARQIADAGAPVQVRWFDGGHDGGGIAGTDAVVESWLDEHLRGDGAVDERFAFDVPASATSFEQTRTAPAYPGLDGDGSEPVALLGEPQTVVNPPGGEPASVTSLPGLDPGTPLGRTAGQFLAQGNLEAESARFESAPLDRPVVLTGTPRVQVRVERVAAPSDASSEGAAPSDAAGEGAGPSDEGGGADADAPADGGAPAGADQAVLYAQLSARTGDAERSFPGGVAPVRVRVPEGGAVVDVALPATAWSLAPGDRLVLTLRTTDSQFGGSTAPAAYRVAVEGPVELPTVATGETRQTAGLPSPAVLIGIGATLLAALGLLVFAILRGRRARPGSPTTLAARPHPSRDHPLREGPPLAIRGLTKRFRSGFVAVDDVSFTVERGQVLGLLGENGAGKTTTLRMVAGLIRPDAGSVEAFGAPVGPSAPVLARLGCFIEGPGFLPHLSGRRNLELYWAATGRPRREAHFDDALAVADLGGALAKPVRGYSQGMRQRLAIAQAMLGLPDLLVLDEPTNGLDPPQITALRGVLRRYAEGGRTVIVSSHLLAEVERTCSHVVVMSHGKVVAAGPVGELAGEASELVVEVTDVEAALAAVRTLGVERAERAGADAIRVAPGALPVDAVVAAIVHAGVGVTDLKRGRHLEETFLALISATEPSA